MSVRVNLLPRATKEGARNSRQRVIAGVVVLLVLAGLATATLLQRGTLSDAENELADAQAELTAAQADVASLATYAELEAQLSDVQGLIREALRTDTTVAGVLQDVALVMPNSAAISSLAITISPTVDEAGTVTSVGSLAATVEVEASHAPGVERFLLQLERVAGFDQVYPGGSTIDEDDIASFSVTMQLGPEYLTRRYQDSLEVQP